MALLGGLLLDFQLDHQVVLGVGLDLFANVLEEIAPAASAAGPGGCLRGRGCRI